jgi:phthalate 4,5-dioxygenase
MLSHELNERLSRTGPGTPMGELFRRFWLPAVVANELKADGTPVRLRLLHEDLLAFRDTSGAVGIVESYCAHRLAPLFFGRNEECGLRCPYHGWKFNVSGACVDIPNVAPEQAERMRNRVALKSYPTQEAGGVIWVYMGPPDLKPSLPKHEITLLPAEQTHASRWLQRTNWLVGLEGEIDTAHISWLHKHFDPATNPLAPSGANVAFDGAPEITLQNTNYGFTYGARRQHEDDYYWRITHWLTPMFSLIPRTPGRFTSGTGRAWVPIDDDNVTTFNFYFRTDGALNEKDLAFLADGVAFPPRLERGTVQLSGRTPIDTFLPIANFTNDYLIDRDYQKNVNYSGIWGANEQDRALQESMRMCPGSPGLVDRQGEHLMASDRAIVAMRQRLLRMAAALAEGHEPTEPESCARTVLRAISKITKIDNFDAVRKEFAPEICPYEPQFATAVETSV